MGKEGGGMDNKRWDGRPKGKKKIMTFFLELILGKNKKILEFIWTFLELIVGKNWKLFKNFLWIFWEFLYKIIW